MASPSGNPPGSILAVGGAEDKVKRRGILQRFVKEAGGKKARIAIVPTASTIPDERAAFYREVFAGLGAGESIHVPIVTRKDAQSAVHADALATATGVFLTGGDQTRLVSVLAKTRGFEAMRRGLVAGGVVAGTSAGASAFSETMIVGGANGLRVRRDAVRLAPGLGVITRIIIDQHFSERGRIGRLLSAVAQEPHRLGVGIDEDTAIVYYGNGEMEIIGSGQVFILDASRAAAKGLDGAKGRPFTLSGVVVHILVEGDRFNVASKEMLLPGEAADEKVRVET
jgi:cyanophycinase